MTGDGLDLLKPFLPGLEAALDHPLVYRASVTADAPSPLCSPLR